jgi:peptide/nickel transport system substrate-binding protein
MNQRFKERFALLTRKRHIPYLAEVEAHIKTLPPGDRLIAGFLGALVVMFGLLGLYSFVRSFYVEVPAQGGSITEGVLGSPRFVNPLLALSDSDRDLSTLTFAGLMGAGKDGTLVPVLAESYDITEEGKVYTFRLREGIEFSDGTPVTPDDVVFTIEKAQDPSLKSPELPNWSNILVEAVDARTVRFTLPKAYAPFLESTTLGILPAHLFRNMKNEEFPFSPLMTNPVGAGPFTVTSVKRNSDGIVTSYELSAFKAYALGRPYLDTIRFVFFSREDDLQAALSSGRVQSAYGIPDERALRAPFAQAFGVFWNPDENPVYNDASVRHALSVATDREAIAEDVLGGYGTPLYGPVPPGSGIDKGGLEESFTSLTERTARAAEILEEGGWTYDTDARIWANGKKGQQLSVTLKTSNVPELKTVAQKVQEDWERLGVPVSIELYEPGDLTQNVIRPRRFEALLFGMVVGREHDLYAFWHSSQRNDPGLNISSYTNRVVDELLEEIRETQDAEARSDALRQINNFIALDYPAVFTHTPDFVYVPPKGIEGIGLPQITSPADRFATVALWYRNTEAVWPFLVPRSE